MSVEKFWMVVDVSSQQCIGNNQYINRVNAPRFMHETEKSADIECLRLAKTCPNGEFVVLEAVRYAKPVSNNWANLTNKSPVKSIRLDECLCFEPEIPF